jgi:sulfate adenylyltransferase subunit 1
MEEYLSFVIVGHIDHGKSTLIGRLLYDTGSLPEGKIEEIKKTCEMLGKPLEFAYVMDHLDEEREKGITIDTAQIFFKKGKRDYVIIDAPGHKEFIKNMLTGASQADAALLIVDVDEGVREQTRRHSYLLGMLGIKQVIVVFNKMDKIGYKKERFEEVKDELEKFLSNFNIKPSYMIPISAKEGDNVVDGSVNMDWYNGITVIEALNSFKNRLSLRERPLRFPLQDVYERDGKKIFVGRIESGRIRKGDSVSILPSGETAVVTSIENFGPELFEAGAGRSTGITLSDEGGAGRGSMICGSDSKPKPKSRIKANVFWMGNEPLKKEEEISYKSTTQEVRCRIVKIHRKINSSTLELLGTDSDELGGLEAGEVSLELESAVVVDDFNDMPPTGRFVLVRNGLVQGGGIVIPLE